MYFYNNLYVSRKIRHPQQAKWKLQHRAGFPNLYVLMLSGDPLQPPAPGGNQFELLHNAFLQQGYYRQNPPYVIGLADGWHDAVKLASGILQEALEATGKADIYPYLFPEGSVAEYFTEDPGIMPEFYRKQREKARRP